MASHTPDNSASKRQEYVPLRDTLAAMIEQMPHGACCYEPDREAPAMLATPQGQALAALVEAAEAWADAAGDVERVITDDALVDAIDRYREATS